MPDQSTPVTDDDRKAHEWCDSVEQNPNLAGDKAHAAARAIRAHVPAPPVSLAEELRKAASGLSVESKLKHQLVSLADRVEAVVKDRDDLQDIVDSSAGDLQQRDNEIERLDAEVELMKEQDEARKDELHKYREIRKNQRQELARLNIEVERLTDELDKAKHGDWLKEALPDPVDVPMGEAWIVEVEGEEERLLGLRNCGDSYPWETFSFTSPGSGGWCADTGVTLVARLVRDVRRVIYRPEDLDKLPVGSIVMDQRGCPWLCAKGGYWMFGAASHKADYVVQLYGPVTVIHEPTFDSAPRS